MGISFENAVHVACITYLLVTILPILKYRFRKKFLYSLLIEKKDIDMYLEEVEKDINKRYSRFKDEYLLDKAAGLFVYKGKLDEAYKILLTIKPKKLLVKTRWVYYYYLILNLFEMGKIDEAKLKFNKNYNQIIKLKTTKIFKISANTLEAIKMYFSGETEKSKEVFLQLQNLKATIFDKAQINFYLGLINRDFGEEEEAKKHFVVASEIGKGTFVETKANIQLKGLENLG